MKKTTSGFTIVELLIVIVVIAILAAISIVAYNGIQQRARDTQRVQDIASIRKALEMYKAVHQNYPAPIANATYTGWDASPGATWLDNLSDFLPDPPVDPINDGTHMYAYYRDSAGSYGCPTSAGSFYTLRIVGLEQVDGREISDLGPCKDSTGLSASRTPTATQAVFFGFSG